MENQAEKVEKIKDKIDSLSLKKLNIECDATNELKEKIFKILTEFTKTTGLKVDNIKVDTFMKTIKPRAYSITINLED